MARTHNLKLTYEHFEELGRTIEGCEVGKYVVFEGQLGVGGFGSVYQGMHNATKQQVAIKLIDLRKIREEPNQRLREITMRLAQSEDVMMRKCGHPNIVACYDVYQNEDLKIIAMEHLSGGSLQEYVSSRNTLPESEALPIVKQILNGVGQMHEKGIIHRDLKPDNIMLNNGVFKIIDFGFSKHIGFDTSKGTVLGTVTTMAPEVARRQNYSLKADIWSVGAILYFMLFGEFTFDSLARGPLIREIEERGHIFTAEEFENGHRGKRLTRDTADFLAKLLTLNQKFRPGWKQVINHPVFKQQPSGIPKSAIMDMQLQVRQGIDSKLNPEDNFDDKNQSEFRKSIGDSTESIRSRMSSEQMAKRKREVKKSEQDIRFDWMSRQLVQCQKLELFHQKILEPIEREKLLDLEERRVVEFLYIIALRGFQGLSGIIHEMKPLRQRMEFIKKVYPHVHELYLAFKSCFETHSKALFEEEERILNRLSDFFTSKEELLEKDRHLNGFKGHDYTEEEQLSFIHKHYLTPLRQDLKKTASGEEVSRYMANYTAVCELRPEQVLKQRKKSFDSIIRAMVRQ